jgi:phosphatidylcholine synthase
MVDAQVPPVSASVPPTVVAASSSLVRRAWAVHLFTTLGAVVGMLALEAVFDNRAKAVMIYLLLTQVIDGIDGPMARQVDIQNTVPKIDGYVLDLVIDYVTCVIVPAAFLHQFDLLPHALSLPLAGLIVFLSAIWFSRTDMMTDDHWFNGFPATWNLIAPSMFILHTPRWANALAVLGLCGLMMTNVKFPHPVRSLGMRNVTLVFTVAWLLALTWASIKFDRESLFAKIAVVLCFSYFFGLCAWRTRLEKERTSAGALAVA